MLLTVVHHVFSHPWVHTAPPLLCLITYSQEKSSTVLAEAWGPHPTMHWAELQKATPHPECRLLSWCWKDAVKAFLLTLRWASSATIPPLFSLITPPNHSPFSRSHEGLYVRTNDSREISSQRSDGWKKVTLIPAFWQVATSWPEEVPARQFQTNRRMASKIPLAQIILTYFLLKWEGKDWQHCLKCSEGLLRHSGSHHLWDSFTPEAVFQFITL